MKKPNFDIKRRKNNHRYNNHRSQSQNDKIECIQKSFSIDKLNEQPVELVELFKLIQVVRHDRIKLQEKYNKYRNNLNSDIMSLESELVKMKKQYNIEISALHEEYNSVKSNSEVELAKLRKG